MQAPIKAGKFGAKLSRCIFHTSGKTSFASRIGRITFFNCNNHIKTNLFGEYISLYK